MLRGIETPEVPMKHTDLSCDQCRRKPITTTWYTCTVCDNYDVCVDCKKNCNHDKTHMFEMKGEKLEEKKDATKKGCFMM